MNKRSAMLVAAGLVLTLFAGGIAIAVGLTGPASSVAATRLTHKQKDLKPIVKTIKRTVTVHKKASPVAATVVASGVTASSGSTSSSGYSGSSSSTSGTSYADDTSHEDSYPDEMDSPEPSHSGGGDD